MSAPIEAPEAGDPPLPPVPEGAVMVTAHRMREVTAGFPLAPTPFALLSQEPIPDGNPRSHLSAGVSLARPPAPH